MRERGEGTLGTIHGTRVSRKGAVRVLSEGEEGDKGGERSEGRLGCRSERGLV